LSSSNPIADKCFVSPVAPAGTRDLHKARARDSPPLPPGLRQNVSRLPQSLKRDCGNELKAKSIAKQNIARANWGPVLGRCRDLPFALGTARSPIFLWFKGQRDLSLGNDFNRQWLETARIATLSQQIAQRGPNRIFPVIAITPHHASTGAGGACVATWRLETRPQFVLVFKR
jgi:hypothetical protein